MNEFLEVLLTISQISVTVEQIFSSMKRIETGLNLTYMSTARLSALLYDSIERVCISLDKQATLQHQKKNLNEDDYSKSLILCS